MSLVKTFSHTHGFQIHAAPTSLLWESCQARNSDGSMEVYQRVRPGVALDRDASHVAVDMTDEGVSKADMHIGDLVYFTNESLVNGLNKHLESVGAPFGPFFYVSEVALKLAQLRHKPNKAASFRCYLDAYAMQMGFDVMAFEEWQHVIYAKDRRDCVAHQLKLRSEDLSFLSDLVSNEDSCIAHFKHAVQALIKMAKGKGLE